MIRDVVYLGSNKIWYISILCTVCLLLRRRHILLLPSQSPERHTHIKICSLLGGACKESISGTTLCVARLVERRLLLTWFCSEWSGREDGGGESQWTDENSESPMHKTPSWSRKSVWRCEVCVNPRPQSGSKCWIQRSHWDETTLIGTSIWGDIGDLRSVWKGWIWKYMGI